MVVLCKLWLILDDCFDVSLVIQKPLEESLLDLLVVLLFEEIVMQKLHGTKDEQFTAFERHIECSDWPVSWETDWT